MDNVDLSIKEMIARVRSQNLIAEAITEQWGERCPEFGEGCYRCEAWRQYDEARAAIAAMQGWRDIESVPDNERVLMTDGNSVEAAHIYRCGDGSLEGITELSEAEGIGGFTHPTHWQPLPAPPETQE